MSALGTEVRFGDRTLLMAIVNVSPDSFSGDGVGIDAAIAHGVGQFAAGADILDVGGESTRPGFEAVDEATELARVVPVIAALRARNAAVPISIDTTKPTVARAALDAGATIINCIDGDSQPMLDVAVERRVPIVLMHNGRGRTYDGDCVEHVVRALRSYGERALACGLPRESVVLDPGIGFGKTPDQNVALLQRLSELCALGFPTLLGASRKATIGALTGRPLSDRASGTAATTALAIAAGVDVVRVHDVAITRDVIAVADAIVRNWRPASWTA